MCSFHLQIYHVSASPVIMHHITLLFSRKLYNTHHFELGTIWYETYIERLFSVTFSLGTFNLSQQSSFRLNRLCQSIITQSYLAGTLETVPYRDSLKSGVYYGGDNSNRSEEVMEGGGDSNGTASRWKERVRSKRKSVGDDDACEFIKSKLETMTELGIR